MIVLDASAVIEMLLWTKRGQAIARRVDLSDSTLHAPQLLTIEVAQVLRRLNLAGEVSTQRAARGLGDLADLDIQLYDHEVLLPRIWAMRKNLTAYDASYVALAEALDASLMTLDERLARSPGLKVDVIVP